MDQSDKISDISLASLINNLKLLNVRIANHTILGSSTTLKCTYDLEGEHLYSVKWYKNGDEFFRYLPKSKPNIQVFEKSGIYID
ncbi:Ig-like domain-containing protein, partial [Aphis craccivora]